MSGCTSSLASATGKMHNTLASPLRPDGVAGDRLYTHWLKVLGHGAYGIPMLDVELTRAGNDIKSVSAQVRTLRRSLSDAALPIFSSARSE